MIERYLMTQSLLSAWQYAIKLGADAEANFMRTLRREPSITTADMQKGIDFEDLVTRFATGAASPEDAAAAWSGPAQKIADIVRGGQLQYKCSKPITVDMGFRKKPLSILLYGRLDCLKSGVIYDIKFSGKYKRGRYYDSPQHPMYLEIVPEADQFIYLISDGRDVFTETYRRESVRDIHQDIREFISWIDGQGLLPLYKQKWLALSSRGGQ